MKIVFLLLVVQSVLASGQLRISSNGFKMEEDELRTLFEETMAVFPEDNDPPLFISRHRDGPIVLFERTPRGEVAIQLDSEDRYYSQIIYQFAHEFAHVRARFQALDHPNKWLEETFCEVASLFALRQLHRRWKDQAPNEALENYRSNLTHYAGKVMKTREPLTLKNSPTYYQQHRKTLRSTSTRRNLNGSFANLILPLLESEPQHWRVLAHFPRIADAPLREHFQAWRNAVPQKHHSFLSKVEAIFLQ